MLNGPSDHTKPQSPILFNVPPTPTQAIGIFCGLGGGTWSLFSLALNFLSCFCGWLLQSQGRVGIKKGVPSKDAGISHQCYFGAVVHLLALQDILADSQKP